MVDKLTERGCTIKMKYCIILLELSRIIVLHLCIPISTDKISTMPDIFNRSFGPTVSIKLSVQTNLYRPCWQGFLEIAVKYPKIDLRPSWKTISSLGHLPPPGKIFWMVSQFILRQLIPRRPKFALSSGRIQHYLKSGYIFELSWSNTAKLLFYLTDEL